VEIIRNFQNVIIIYNYLFIFIFYIHDTNFAMLHELRGNDWHHKSRDYKIKNHSNLNAKFKMDIFNKNGWIFLQDFAHIVKFVLLFGRCSFRIPDRSQTVVTEALRLVTQYRQITLNDSDNFLQNLIFSSLLCFHKTWPRTGTIDLYVCSFDLQKR